MEEENSEADYSQYPSGWSEDPEDIPDLEELAVVPIFPSWYDELLKS